MSFIDKIKDFVNVPDDDGFYDEESEQYGAPYEEDESQRYTPHKERKQRKEQKYGADSSDYSDFADSYAGGGRFSEKNEKPNKVVNIHTTTQVQVVLVKPERLEEVEEIADHLNAKRTVVLNLETTQRDIARRIVDFLQGVAYANGGGMRRVAASTFIIIPHNVNIVGDLIDELENNGVFF